MARKSDSPEEIEQVRQEHPDVMIEVVKGGVTARELEAASDLIGERLRDELVEVVVHALDPEPTVSLPHRVPDHASSPILSLGRRQ